MGGVILNQLPELLLLRIPNVASLATIREYFNTFGYLDSFLKRPTLAHVTDRAPVRDDEVGGLPHGA